MPYTVDQLIEDFRSDVYDRADVDGSGNRRDTLWSAEDVLRYANMALAQWGHDTLFVRRNIRMNVTPGKAAYYCGQDIIEINRAAFTVGPNPAARPRKLTVFNLEDASFDDDYGTVFLSSFDILNRQGTPRGVTQDYDPSNLRLYPIPTEVGFLDVNLTVYPAEVQYGMVLPSSNRRDLHLLLLWMKHLAYRKQDADVLDLTRADAFYAEYRVAVIDRKYELDRERRNGGVMSPRW